MGLAEDFEVWLEQVADGLVSYAKRFCHHAELGEDAAQEALKYVCQHRHELERKDLAYPEFRAYLFQAVRTYVYAYRRDREEREKPLEVEPPSVDRAARTDLQEAVWSTLEQLPEEMRIIAACLYDGEKSAAIGRRLAPHLRSASAQSKYGKPRVEEVKHFLRKQWLAQGLGPDDWPW